MFGRHLVGTLHRTLISLCYTLNIQLMFSVARLFMC